jgi:hypothetical protein
MKSRARAADEAAGGRLPDDLVEEKKPLAPEDEERPEEGRSDAEDSGWPGPIDEPPPLLT